MTKRKLFLSKDTLRDLTADELRGVLGGNGPTVAPQRGCDSYVDTDPHTDPTNPPQCPTITETTDTIAPTDEHC